MKQQGQGDYDIKPYCYVLKDQLAKLVIISFDGTHKKKWSLTWFYYKCLTTLKQQQFLDLQTELVTVSAVVG